MSLFRNMAGVFVTRVIVLAIRLATGVVLARWLSVEDRGLFSVATTVAGMGLLFLRFGWPDASIYRLRRVGDDASRVAGAGFLATAAASILAALLVWQLEPFLSARFLDGAPAAVLLLAVASLPFQLLGTIFSAIARGLDRFALQNRYQVATRAGVLLGLAIVLVVLDGGVLDALAAELAAWVLVTVAFVITVLRHSGASFRVRAAELRDNLRFGAKSYTQALAAELHERIDIFMIAYLLQNPEQVAYYTIAVGLVSQLKIVPEAVGSALYPELARLGPGESAQLTAYVGRHSIAITVAMVLILATVAPWLVTFLFGEEYRPSVAPLLVLLPALGFHTLYRVVFRWFMAMDSQRSNIISQLIAVAVNVGLNLWWIPAYGILGAAWASLVSYALGSLLITGIFCRASGVGPGQLLVLGRGDVQEQLRRWRRRDS